MKDQIIVTDNSVYKVHHPIKIGDPALTPEQEFIVELTDERDVALKNLADARGILWSAGSVIRDRDKNPTDPEHKQNLLDRIEKFLNPDPDLQKET